MSDKLTSQLVTAYKSPRTVTSNLPFYQRAMTLGNLFLDIAEYGLEKLSIALDYLTPSPKQQVFTMDPLYHEDLYGFPGDTHANMSLIYSTIDDAFKTHGTLWCLGGYQAWEYYNVPKVVGVRSQVSRYEG